jgi:hypothetical protein
MATITRELLIAAHPETVRDALRDFHTVHKRFAPGFLTTATSEGEDRILTFVNGLVARERLVGCDDATRRIAYTIVESRFAYHHASVQVFSHERGSRVVCTSNILPDSLTESFSAMMDRGSETMIQTLATDVRSGFTS